MTELLHDGRGRRLYLTGDERAAFLAAAVRAPRPARTFCGVLAHSGCRVSEALKLTPRRVDPAGRALVFETLKKRRKGVFRAVPVPPGRSGTSSNWCTAWARPGGAGTGTSTAPCGRGRGATPGGGSRR